MSEMARDRVGTLAIAIGFALGAIGLGVFQAWWAAAFAVGGVVVDRVVRREGSVGTAIGAGLAVSASLVLGALGLFLVSMSQFARGRPGLPEGNGLDLLVSGIGALVVAALGLALIVRHVRRRPSAAESKSSDERTS